MRGKKMRRKKLLLATLTAIITLALIGTIGTSKVSASSTARIYVYPDYYDGPMTAGTAKMFEVRIDSSSGYGAPHETSEPAVNTDKTWSWEIVITFDPDVCDITADPTRHASRDWFNTFHKWYWDPDWGEWIDEGSYPNFFAGAHDATAGELAATCTLTGDPTTDLLPEDDFGEKSFPNAWLHAGSYYDLPYTNGIETSSLVYPPGGWSGNFFVLFRFRLIAKVDIPTPPDIGGTWVHISKASLWMYDAETTYDVNTEDSRFGQPPVASEFPLGLAAEIGLIAAVVYIWWMRKRKLPKVVP